MKDIRGIIGEAALQTKKISIPDKQELEIAYNKYRQIVEKSREL